jgi:DsbC/DsbD-like thiol-disulfide interchange protein
MTFKQKSLHRAWLLWSKARLFAAVCVSCTVFCTAVPGALLAQTPKSSDASSLHLIAAPGLRQGSYVAGIDISMAPGSHTYWKQPGDAGVPPVFVFTGSENVARADVLYPAPARIVADGLVSFGYTNTVVFPVKVTPSDPSKPSRLHLDMTYAVCNVICMPAHGDATLTLDPSGAGTGAGPIEAALATVPRAATPAERADLTIAPDKAIPGSRSKASWTLTWTGEPAVDDIFADAPDGFYFDTRKRGANSWSLVAAQSVGAPTGKSVPVSLILTRKGAANLTVTEKLDATAPTQ